MRSPPETIGSFGAGSGPAADLAEPADQGATLSLDISCPNCNTDDHLSGQRRDHVIVITCAQCGLDWERPVAPHCATCGSTDVVAFPVPLLERSRGTQMSITAMHIETLCRICDADRLADRGEGHLPKSLGDD